jgi:thioredoxin-dependent peroxiredoxin
MALGERCPARDVELVEDVEQPHAVAGTDRGDTLALIVRRAASSLSLMTRTTPTARGEEEREMVVEGELAPDFTLTSDSGEAVTLSSLRGRPVVLYFYPKDDTPGCTAQACGIRDSYDEFEHRGAVVLGVSPDEESSHVEFKQKYGLPFTLLADPEHEVAERYGVWGERKYMGNTYMGVERSTFLIDDDGRIAKVMRRVKPGTHAERVLAELTG